MSVYITVLHWVPLTMSSVITSSGGFRGGARGACPPPLGTQILSISCSFQENLAKLYVGAPPGKLVPSPGEILDLPLMSTWIQRANNLVSSRHHLIDRNVKKFGCNEHVATVSTGSCIKVFVASGTQCSFYGVTFIVLQIVVILVNREPSDRSITSNCC